MNAMLCFQKSPKIMFLYSIFPFSSYFRCEMSPTSNIAWDIVMRYVVKVSVE